MDESRDGFQTRAKDVRTRYRPSRRYPGRYAVSKRSNSIRKGTETRSENGGSGTGEHIGDGGALETNVRERGRQTSESRGSRARERPNNERTERGTILQTRLQSCGFAVDTAAEIRPNPPAQRSGPVHRLPRWSSAVSGAIEPTLGFDARPRKYHPSNTTTQTQLRFLSQGPSCGRKHRVWIRSEATEHGRVRSRLHCDAHTEFGDPELPKVETSCGERCDYRRHSVLDSSRRRCSGGSECVSNPVVTSSSRYTARSPDRRWDRVGYAVTNPRGAKQPLSLSRGEPSPAGAVIMQTIILSTT